MRATFAAFVPTPDHALLRALHRELRALELTEATEARARLEVLRERLAKSGVSAAERDALLAALDEVLTAERLRVPTSLADAYEDASLALGARLPRLRRVNVRRSLVHVAVGVAALVLLWLADPRTRLWTASCACASVWLLEGARRVSRRWRRRVDAALSATAHPFERHAVTSGTWYATSLCVLAWTTPVAHAAAAVAILAAADPSASYFGRRFGRHAIGRQRTLEGSIAFVATGTFAAGGALFLFGPVAWGLAFAMACAGALGELASVGRVDDNLSIPLAAGLAAHLVVNFFA
ncbi:MAG: hypothetical protein H6722_18770 [Sandaracinus sp.]|nr:hypothetical protein [Myxococcales bacterium]MCB9614487.1 hypothetical protein [Sandaracinus sp.]